VISDPASVDAAIESRFSARAFLPRPVEREVLADLLRVASRAPSGTNTQPWQVYVLQGARKDELVRTICEAHDAISVDPQLATEYREEYDYYPKSGSAPTSTGAANAASACMACWALARATATRCTRSTSATSASSMRPSA
jgi:nitroreductase